MTQTNPAVVNLTSEMKAAASIPAIQSGLFVQFFDNMPDLAISGPSDGAEGETKVLIKPKGRTLSFGSFTDGLLSYRAQVAAQMRRPAAVENVNPFGKDFVFAPKAGPYAECLRLCLVLDLGSATAEAVVKAADALRAAVEGFLKKEGLLVLDRSGGYCRYAEEEVDEDFVGRLEAWASEALVGLG